MQRDDARWKVLSRRALLLAGGQAGLALLLVGRMYKLQILEAARYQLLSEKNSISLRLLAPPRGRILDRSGIALADNRHEYRIVIVAEGIRNIRATLSALGRLITLDGADRRRIRRRLGRVHSFIPVLVRANLRWDKMARIEVAMPELPGVSIEQGLVRSYPLGPAAAHVVGYVGAVAERDLDGDPLLQLPGFRIGKSGIEKAQEARLIGRAGTQELEINAYGRIVRNLRRTPPKSGEDIVTTLNGPLQDFTFRRCSEEPSVASVVLDAASGGVLALVSVPSFDPDAFSTNVTRAMWRALSTDSRHPLLDKVLGGLYPPGSTFKPTVAVAALAARAITPETEFFCPGYLRLGQAVFHCWKRSGHGTLRLHDAIKESCDVYFYHTAMRAGIDQIAATARRFGYDHPTGLGLPGENGGLIPTPPWQLAMRGVRWEPGETLITGIGQGAVLVTPLQIAVMVARLVTGRLVVPRLIKRVAGRDGADNSPDFPPLGIDPKILGIVVDAMDAVVNEPGGTGYALRIPNPAFAMGGKTGTAQVHRISEFEREHGVLTGSKVPWQDRDHALFVGFAPIGAPRYVCAAVVEHGGVSGGEGAQAAGPIVRDVLLELQRRATYAPTPPGGLAAGSPGWGVRPHRGERVKG